MHISEAYEHESILPYTPEKPEEGCPGRNCRKNAEQSVDVSTKLTVAPTANVGGAVVTCQGEPRIVCTNNEGGETVTLTVTQKVRVSVPICFGVTVTPDGSAIACRGGNDAACCDSCRS